MKKIKILYIVPSLRLCNGIASYAMNYFRNINNNNIHIDFATGADEESIYFEEIRKQKSKIFYIPKMELKNIGLVCKQIKKYFQENKYDIVHCHVLNMGAFYLYYAKKYNVPVRILHSHATKYADKPLNSIRNFLLAKLAIGCANTYFACSKLAGDFLFKNKKYKVINNAIDVDKFSYNEKTRIQIRELENIEQDEIVIANIGRFVAQKNIFFLIGAFKKLLLEKENYKLMLIGSGPLEEEIVKKINEYNLKKKVIIKKSITNVNEYMQAIDILAMPSLYEGLPVVGIEAQAADLQCLFSETITKEVKIIDKVKFLPINNIEDWVAQFKNMNELKRKNEKRLMADNCYDIKTESQKLGDIYEKLYKDMTKNRFRRG